VRAVVDDPESLGNLRFRHCLRLKKGSDVLLLLHCLLAAIRLACRSSKVYGMETLQSLQNGDFEKSTFQLTNKQRGYSLLFGCVITILVDDFKLSVYESIEICEQQQLDSVSREREKGARSFPDSDMN
jgi:hypothetical protein